MRNAGLKEAQAEIKTAWRSMNNLECRRHRRDTGLIPGSGQSLEEEMATDSSFLCLENSMNRGAWQAIVRRVVESDMTEHDLCSLLTTILKGRSKMGFLAV